MKHNMHYELTSMADTPETFSYAEDYSFWIPMIEYFFVYADSFEIHCWKEESAKFEDIVNELPNVKRDDDGQLLIANGQLNEKAKELILTRSLDAKGRLKWFSVFLERQGELLFSSEHYGMELIGYELNAEQIAFLEKVLPKDVRMFEW
ncbi:hypothetical protein PO902_00515 [Planococcus maritimus]|nr:hypothetical protein [Planococcus sp. SK3692]MDE4083559.1 hypothetical protein [Planococcus maritimus]